MRRHYLYRVLYGVGLFGIVSFLASCDECYEPDPKDSWVTCVNGRPVLTNGKDQSDDGPLFNPNDYKCPDDRDSPIWTGSGKPVYSTTPLKSPAGALRAAGASTTAYLPRTVLDLPFRVQTYFNTPASATCATDSPDMLQVHHDNALVTRISTCPFAVKNTIRVASRPLQIAITPDGTMAVVTSFDNAINFIDLATNRVAATMNVNFNPHGIAITSDGSTAYVSSFNNTDPLIAIIDLTSRTVKSTFSIATYPQSVFLSPDDAQLYVLFPFSGAVYIIDTMTNVVAGTLAVSTPRGMAFNSTGTKAYITSAGPPGTVQQLDTETFRIEKSYAVGAGPTDVEVLYGDRIVAVNNFEGQSVSTIDTVTGKVTTLPQKSRPIGLAVVR